MVQMATKSKSRSSSFLNKNGKRSSVLSVKKDRLSASNVQRSSVDETFEVYFKTFCAQLNSSIVPEVVVVPKEPLPGGFPNILPTENLPFKKEDGKKTHKSAVATVLVIYESYDMQINLNAIIFKHFRVDRSMLIALSRSLEKFNILGTLKLEFCQLENTDLRTLKTILQKNELITELSINGNPNKYQNFYILLKNNKLSQISMRFCQINDRGAQLIAQNLSTPFEQTLIAINLSSNFISDEGVVAISNALRINRNLLSLNLADNWLTDVGCFTLMGVLKSFVLRHDEIVVRRHRIMDGLLTKAEMVENKKKLWLISGMQNLHSDSKRSSKDSSVKAGKDGSTRKSSKGHSPRGSTFKKEVAATNNKESIDLDWMQQIREEVEKEMQTDRHPFVKDSYAKNKEIYCKGNVKLIHLNIAYNKITEHGLQEIIDTLRYQQTIVGVNHPLEGLSHIVLEGNHFPEMCSEIIDINEVIRETYSIKHSSSASTGSRRTSKRKRSRISRVSITT